MENQQLHVLIFSSWFPTDDKPFLGNFVVQQAKTLSKEYKVTVFRLLEMGKKDTLFLDESNFSVQTAYYQSSKNPLTNYFNKRKAIKAALNKVESVDLIHAHVSYPLGWVIALIKRVVKKPLLLTEHGSYFREGFKWNYKFTLSVYFAHKAADKIVAVSEFLRRDILKKVYGKQVEVLFNPVVLQNSSVEKNNEKVELLHISTLDQVKNVVPILEAIAAVKKIGKAIRLTIVSDEDSSKVQLEVNRLGVNDCVVFKGPVLHEEIQTYYEKADAFILNSSYESFSIVVAEAWSNGIPVISTSVGIADNMSPDLGLLTDGTAASIETAILKLTEQKVKFDSDFIKSHAQQFSEDTFLNRIKVIYQSLLN